MRGRAAVVLQQPEWALNPRLRIGTSASEPLTVQGARRDERHRRVAQALTQVGLDPEMASRYPHELSGGQRQRAAIARAPGAEPAGWRRWERSVPPRRSGPSPADRA